MMIATGLLPMLCVDFTAMYSDMPNAITRSANANPVGMNWTIVPSSWFWLAT